MSSIKVGSKQNILKTLTSDNGIKNQVKAAKDAGLTEISKILLSEQEVTYLRRTGYKVIDLWYTYPDLESMTKELGSLKLIETEELTNWTEEQRRYGLLRPYKIVINPIIAAEN